MPQFLFAYGTLRLNTHHKMAARLAECSKLVALGYIKEATLFKIDWYPALLHEGQSEDIVIGDIYQLNDESLLLELDDYEGLSTGNPPFEYRREKVKVFSEKKIYDCWVYWYNIPLPEKAERIESGDFLNP